MSETLHISLRITELALMLGGLRDWEKYKRHDSCITSNALPHETPAEIWGVGWYRSLPEGMIISMQRSAGVYRFPLLAKTDKFDPGSKEMHLHVRTRTQ